VLLGLLAAAQLALLAVPPAEALDMRSFLLLAAIR
jgi:hypothetical protein